MIGFDKPLRPEWVYAVHQAWQSHMPARQLLELVDREAAEMPGAETRHKIGTIILRYFVETEGHGPGRLTVAPNWLATLAGRYTAQDLAPVYLAYLIARTTILASITSEIVRRYQLGDEFTAKDFLRRIYAEYGQRGVVYNCVKYFLRTLAWFGPLRALGSGRYVRREHLELRAELFPAALYAWATAGSRVQVEADHVREAAAFAFIDLAHLDDWLARYDGRYWSLVRRPAAQLIILRFPQPSQLTAAFASGAYE